MPPTTPGRFEALLNLADIALVEVRDRRIVWANAAMHRILGYEPDELIDRPTRQFFPDLSSYEAFGRDLDSHLNATGRHTCVAEQVRKDGSTGWFEFHVTRAKDEPDRLVGVIVDRGRSRGLADDHNLASERYRAVVEDQTEVISRFRPDGTFVFVNEVYCRLFGKTQDELIGRKWQPTAHPDDLSLIEAKLRQMAPGNPVVVIENRVYVASGELRWMQFVNRGFFEADGRISEVQSIGRDITDRKLVEERLAESMRRLELALQGADLGVWDFDLISRSCSFDARCCALLGREPEEMQLSMDGWHALIHPADLPSVREAIRAHEAGDVAAIEVEHRLHHKYGHWVWVLVRGKVASNSDGRPVRATGTILDITDRKRVAVEGMDLLRKIQGLISGLDAPLAGSARAHASAPADRIRLTGRSLEMLRLIAEGKTTAQIANELCIAESTAKTHRRNLMRKLGLANKADLVRYAVRRGIVAS